MPEEIRIETNDPEVAREEIERTRARMSSTLDEIEILLTSKKKRIQEQLDVVARIREKPLHAAGAVLVGGLLLGFITGGGRRDDVEASAAKARGAAWERRARRLLEIARAQEEEVERLRSARGPSGYGWGATELDDDEALGDDFWEDPDDGYHGGGGYAAAEDDDWDGDGMGDDPSSFSLLKEAVTERVLDFVSEAATSFLDGIRSRR